MTGGKTIKLLIKLVNSSCVVKDIGPRVMVLAALPIVSYVWYLKCRIADVRLSVTLTGQMKISNNVPPGSKLFCCNLNHNR